MLETEYTGVFVMMCFVFGGVLGWMMRGEYEDEKIQETTSREGSSVEGVQTKEEERKC